MKWNYFSIMDDDIKIIPNICAVYQQHINKVYNILKNGD